MAKESDEPSRSKPKVAVLIAAYNVAETIGKAVVSALAQLEAAEVVVVDDASRDDTYLAAQTVAAGNPRLTVIRNERNLGSARSRNTAISQTASPYIANLDGDAFWKSGLRKFSPLEAELFARTMSYSSKTKARSTSRVRRYTIPI